MVYARQVLEKSHVLHFRPINMDEFTLHLILELIHMLAKLTIVDGRAGVVWFLI